MSDNVLKTYANAAKLSLALGYEFNAQTGKRFIESMMDITSPANLDMVGIIHSGQPGEAAKGMFTRTTYPDMIESETEYGYANIAQRVLRNLGRMAE